MTVNELNQVMLPAFSRLIGGVAFLRRAFISAAVLVVAWPVQATELALPPLAEMTATRVETLSSLRLPTGPFAQGALPTELVEGALEISAFRVPLEGGGSTLGLMQVLRDQLAEAGFAETFSCEAAVCGGFDFRYGLEILAEPDMHVNLGDYRYLVAKGPDGAHLSIVVSRAGQVGFVQLTRVTRQLAGPLTSSAAKDALAQPAAAPPPKPLAIPVKAGLESGLSVVLEDLIFPSGSSSLANEVYGSLQQLAEWLRTDPARQVILVGHTDASGALDANIALSKLRAESVRQVLMTKWRLPPNQLRAEGVGPLSPRASNLTENGRKQNRRVEVMATSTLGQ